MTRTKHIVIGIVMLAVVAAFIAIPRMNNDEDKPEITVFKSASCGCCSIYSNYMRKGYKVTIVNTEDRNSAMGSYDVPANLRSCHTTLVGDYFVEGHIPMEAVAKLMSEKPDIKGIAMPGMPSGSPGMPGAKRGPFIVYAVNNDGSYQEYMRL